MQSRTQPQDLGHKEFRRDDGSAQLETLSRRRSPDGAPLRGRTLPPRCDPATFSSVDSWPLGSHWKGPIWKASLHPCQVVFKAADGSPDTLTARGWPPRAGRSAGHGEPGRALASRTQRLPPFSRPLGVAGALPVQPKVLPEGEGLGYASPVFTTPKTQLGELNKILSSILRLAPVSWSLTGTDVNHFVLYFKGLITEHRLLCLGRMRLLIMLIIQYTFIKQHF